MRFSVKSVLNTPGKSMPFRFTMDLSDVEFGGQCPAQEPVEVDGTVRNSADVLELSLRARTTLDCTCDRCGEEYDADKTVRYDCVLAEERASDESDDIIVLANDEVDVEELARDAFILDMDTKFLCSEDCKGLCSGCGANLNREACRCKKAVDPRLARLAQLLQNDE